MVRVLSRGTYMPLSSWFEACHRLIPMKCQNVRPFKKRWGIETVKKCSQCSLLNKDLLLYVNVLSNMWLCRLLYMLPLGLDFEFHMVTCCHLSLLLGWS